MSRWFRHYAGMMRDDKLVRAALRCGQSIERVAWVWGAILESAGEINDDGKYDFDAAEAAYFLRADEAELRSIEASLVAGGRLSENRVVKWGNRQFKSDDSADRVRRHRDKQRIEGGGVQVGGRQEPDRYSNGDVTECNAPETETELDTEKNKDRPKRVRTLCSDDFEIFWKAYPRTPNMSKSEAWKSWQRLSDEDRVAATAAVPKYIAFLRSKTDHPTVHACRFLSQRRFDGFNEAVSANAQQTAQIFVPLDSPRWGHLCSRWRDQNKAITGPPPKDYPAGTGWYFPSEWVAA